MVENIKKIVANAAVNAELESKKISDETIDMIENCLKTKNGSFLFHVYLKTKDTKKNNNETIVYESINSKYCYDNGVLKNNYGIRDLELLHIVESDSAAYYQSQIISSSDNCGYDFGFDVNSYLALHRKLFASIYPFAGEIRDEFIYKSCLPYLDRKTPFCFPQNIYNSLFNVLLEMRNNIYRIKSEEDLIRYLAYYYGELNMIHPFREGNGRVLRTYFILLVKELNNYISFGEYEIDYSLWTDEDKEDLIVATIFNSVNASTEKIEECFEKVLVKKVKKLKTRK